MKEALEDPRRRAAALADAGDEAAVSGARPLPRPQGESPPSCA
jgi:hypothetical protein